MKNKSFQTFPLKLLFILQMGTSVHSGCHI